MKDLSTRLNETLQIFSNKNDKILFLQCYFSLLSNTLLPSNISLKDQAIAFELIRNHGLYGEKQFKDSYTKLRSLSIVKDKILELCAHAPIQNHTTVPQITP